MSWGFRIGLQLRVSNDDAVSPTDPGGAVNVVAFQIADAVRVDSTKARPKENITRQLRVVLKVPGGFENLKREFGKMCVVNSCHGEEALRGEQNEGYDSFTTRSVSEESTSGARPR